MTAPAIRITVMMTGRIPPPASEGLSVTMGGVVVVCAATGAVVGGVVGLGVGLTVGLTVGSVVAVATTFGVNVLDPLPPPPPPPPE